ncbi:ATP-dependent DNA helicase, partial [Candidatus Bipolaricaulota bacterium]
MPIAWDRLGLARFRVVLDQDEAFFSDGTLCEDGFGERESLPIVAYGEIEPGPKVPVFDAKAMARVLHPTLPDHELETVCAAHGIARRKGEAARVLGEAFVALVAEAVRLDREVVGLLARLEPEPLATLFARALRLSRIPDGDPAPAEDENAAGGESEPQAPPDAVGVDPFGPDGFVARELPSFEQRDGQIDMARSVGKTFREGGALVVEAGPGTGKTFAYLIPAIDRMARDETVRVAVSTRTKQLQEQLFAKDLPFLLGRMAPDLKAAILKGRQNYLCLRRWEIAVREFSEGLERDRLHLLAPLARWLWETETGDIDENTAFLADPGGRELWRQLCDSHHHCIDSFCPHYEECFSIGARRRARKARLVVVNHSLLLNDLVVDRMILGKYTHAVIDEAHALEETARSVFTWTLSARVVERLADELTPSRRRRFGWLRRLALPGNGDEVRRATDRVTALRTGTTRLFSVLGRDLPVEGRGPLPRLDANSAAALERMKMTTGRLEESMQDLVDGIEDPELRREGEVHIASIRDLGGLAARLAAEPEEDTVRWYERERSGISLHITPLEVAPILERILYPALEAIVMTSATLSVDEDFGFVLRTLGLDLAFEDVDTKVVASPFSYEEHMRVCVPAAFPLLTEDADGYADELADLLAAMAGRLDRKGLVLFTSYQMLEAVRRRLPRKVTALAQGVDGPRSKLIERFRRLPRGVLLLGTDSFWEGVDLPGEELEYLVITRLPFAVPTDPIQAALGELAARSGRDPF